MKATFVYANARAKVIEDVRSGAGPDSTLYGALQLPAHGVEVDLRDPLLSRVQLPAPFDRVAWNLRELTAPFELGRTDVVVTPLAALFPIAARSRRLPAVVLNFGLNLIWRRASPARRTVLRRSLAAAARIVCLGESQRRELLDSTGLGPAHVTTLLVPVDAEFFRPDEGLGEGVVSVGKDLARDYATFAAAVEGLDAPVRVVAHPRNLEGIEIAADVRSGISAVELRELYARARCAVVPQHGPDFAYGSEGGGLTALLEAMAMGKAIVATDRPILRDYVDDGVDALLVPPGDGAAMRAAIERVLSDDELAGSLGEAARARVERAHTSDVFAAKLAELLRSVVYARSR